MFVSRGCPTKVGLGITVADFHVRVVGGGVLRGAVIAGLHGSDAGKRAVEFCRMQKAIFKCAA